MSKHCEEDTNLSHEEAKLMKINNATSVAEIKKIDGLESLSDEELLAMKIRERNELLQENYLLATKLASLIGQRIQNIS